MKNIKLLVGLAVGVGLYFVFKNKENSETRDLVGDENLANDLNQALDDLERAQEDLMASQEEVVSLQGQIQAKETIIQQQITEIADLESQIAGYIASAQNYDDPQIPILNNTIKELEEYLAGEIIKYNELDEQLTNALLLANTRQQEIDLLNSNVNDLNDIIIDKDNAIALKEQEIFDKEDLISELGNTNTTLLTQKDELEANKVLLESQLQGLNADVGTLGATITQKDEIIGVKDAEILTLSNQINEKNTQIASIEIEKNQLQSELDFAIEENSSDDILIQGYIDDINLKNGEISSLNSAKNSLQAELLEAQGDYSTGLSAWNNEKNTLNSEISSLGSDISALNSQIGTLTYQRDTAQNNMVSFQTQLEAKTQELSLAMIDMNELQVENEGYSSDISSLQSEVSSLQSQYNTQASLVTTKQSEINTLNSQLSSMTTNYNNAVSQKNQLQGQLAVSQSNVDGLYEEITELENQLDTAQGTISARETTISGLESDVFDLEAENSELETLNDETLVQLYGADKTADGVGGFQGIVTSNVFNSYFPQSYQQSIGVGPALAQPDSGKVN